MKQEHPIIFSEAVPVLGRQGSNAGVAAPFAATCGRWGSDHFLRADVALSRNQPKVFFGHLTHQKILWKAPRGFFYSQLTSSPLKPILPNPGNWKIPSSSWGTCTPPCCMPHVDRSWRPCSVATISRKPGKLRLRTRAFDKTWSFNQNPTSTWL